jgi:hypothetical protein
MRCSNYQLTGWDWAAVHAVLLRTLDSSGLLFVGLWCINAAPVILLQAGCALMCSRCEGTECAASMYYNFSCMIAQMKRGSIWQVRQSAVA